MGKVLILCKEYSDRGIIFYSEYDKGIIINRYTIEEVTQMIKNNVNMLIL